MPKMLVEASSHLSMCQTMLCQNCWQTLPHICLCAIPCYTKTSGREPSPLFICQTMLCQDCWQTLPHICVCAKPCYAKTAGRDFFNYRNILKVYINYDPEFTLTYFTTMSNFAKYVFSTNIMPKLQDHCSSGFFRSGTARQQLLFETHACPDLKLSGVPVLRKFYINRHSLGNLLTSLGGFTSFCGNIIFGLVWTYI